MKTIKILLSTAFTLAVASIVFSAPALAASCSGGQNGESCSASARIGVQVDTTLPPPTTSTTAKPAPPAPTTTVKAAANTSTTSAPIGLDPNVSSPEIQVPEDAKVIEEAAKQAAKETLVSKFAYGIKSVSNVTTAVFAKVSEGVPVTQALSEVLPPEVATIVIPAVRTASTFAFPMGLALAVMAFLVLQQRVDSNDPKLAAAPIANEERYVEFLR